LTDDLRAFARAGWNEGLHETWNYTECDESVAFGADLWGRLWRRLLDKFGVAFVGNGISHNHQRFLALRGLGFNLGDGALSYGPEKIMERYYNFPIQFRAGSTRRSTCKVEATPLLRFLKRTSLRHMAISFNLIKSLVLIAS
jgi:Carbohydrate-selective porin, OprB family